MSHEVPWNKIIVETFIEEALLTKEEQWVLRTRVAGWSRTKQAMELNISTATVDKVIARLKKKYDKLQVINPLLPPRKSSEKETWMDAH